MCREGLRSTRRLPAPAAGGAGDEVQRSCGEKIEFRPLQWAQRRGEAGIGDARKQERNSGLVLRGSGPPRRALQAGSAEEAMNDPAERLAGFEIVEKTGVALGRRRLRHAPRRRVAGSQIARERDVSTMARLFRHRVQTAVAHRVRIGVEAARVLDLDKPDVGRREAAEGPVPPYVDAAAVLAHLRPGISQLAEDIVLAAMGGEHLVGLTAL